MFKRFFRTKIFILIFSTLLTTVTITPSFAANAGDLDTDFSGDGILTTDIRSDDMANAIAIDSQGYIFVAGTSFNGNDYDFAVTRYGGNGGLIGNFGRGGKVTTSFGRGDDKASAIAIDSLTGDILVAGTSRNADDRTRTFAVVRYDTDGNLVPNFGTGGKITSSNQGGDYNANAIAIDDDGNILIAGSIDDGSDYDFIVARYTSRGILDSTFGTDGILTTAIGDNASTNSITLDPVTGDILVAGYSDNYDTQIRSFAVVRYNDDGSLDTTFDTDGILTTTIGGDSDRANSIAIDSAGNILVAGYSYNGDNDDFAVVRYTSGGTLDSTFDTDGILTTDIGGDDDIAKSIALGGDGAILVVGYSYNGDNDDFAVVRYTSGGSLDTSFDTDGILTTDIGGDDDIANAISMAETGDILVAGTSYDGDNDDFAVVRYTSGGTLDSTFDTDGIVTTGFRTSSSASSITIDGDGNILVAGTSYNGDFAVVRYTSNGTLDPNFGRRGKITTSIGEDARANAIAIYDGLTHVAGTSYNGSDDDFAVARYTNRGTLDSTFGTYGILTTAIGGDDDRAYAIAIDSAGNILVAGYSYNGDNDDFAVVRYDKDGNLDTSFGNGGKIITAVGDNNEEAKAIAIDSAGKILIAGHSYNFDTDISSFAVLRYNDDGSLDTTFDTDGILTTDIGGSEEGRANAIALDSAGNILVAGNSWNGSNDDFTVVRYTSSGTLDSTFDTDGILTTDIGGDDDIAYSIAIDSAGNILVAGTAVNNEDYDTFAVVRYTSSGSLDTRFGNGGKIIKAIGRYSVAKAMVIDSNDRILLAGTSTDTGSQITVARFIGASTVSAPTITSVSPNSGPTAGGTTITITGTNFYAGISVEIGEVICTNISVISSTSLTCRTPSYLTATSVGVYVENTDGGSATRSGVFTYLVTAPPPPPPPAPRQIIEPTPEPKLTAITPIVEKQSNPYVTLNGSETNAVVQANTTQNGMEVVANGWGLSLAVIEPNGNPAPLSPNRSLVLNEDQQVRVSGPGFKPNTEVHVYLFSTPRLIGTTTTDSNGNFIGIFPMLKDVAVGNHLIQVNGISPDNQVRSTTLPAIYEKAKSVVAPPATPTINNLVFVVPFASNKYTLDASQMAILKSVKQVKATKIQVIGYAQPSSTQADIAISLNRALEVKKAVSKLVPKANFITRGSGSKSQPLCAAYKNKCVVVTITQG
jgi:uncharacterized delta-60 repeat protein